MGCKGINYQVVPMNESPSYKLGFLFFPLAEVATSFGQMSLPTLFDAGRLNFVEGVVSQLAWPKNLSVDGCFGVRQAGIDLRHW
jgi:hypothetical protein